MQYIFSDKHLLENVRNIKGKIMTRKLDKQQRQRWAPFFHISRSWLYFLRTSNLKSALWDGGWKREMGQKIIKFCTVQRKKAISSARAGECARVKEKGKKGSRLIERMRAKKGANIERRESGCLPNSDAASNNEKRERGGFFFLSFVVRLFVPLSEPIHREAS